MTARAYTVASLAQEWACSESVIRKLVADGRLQCFRVGNLIRIRAEEVERFECQNTPCSGSSRATQSSGETQGESGTDTDLPRQTALERRLRRGGFGQEAEVLRGPWGPL